MKVEIDLNEILGGDDYGNETLQESVRRQVVEKITTVVNQGIGKRIDAEISKLIDDSIGTAIQDQMPALIDDLMSAKYTQVDRYGSRTGVETTFREQLIKKIIEEMEYKKTDYSSNENIFTKAVNATIHKHTLDFQSKFNKEVDTRFIADCMEHARKKLAERLSVK